MEITEAIIELRKMINIMPERPDIKEQRRKAALKIAAEKLEGMIKDVKRY